LHVDVHAIPADRDVLGDEHTVGGFVENAMFTATPLTAMWSTFPNAAPEAARFHTDAHVLRMTEETTFRRNHTLKN
jgi:hypothetical protein